ncbi:uncharacterized protein PEAK3 [Pteropus alecto]|uniref:PEAK family member 3 n=1 Tax=Pteropus alecto TaxID=9402 RepID=L5L7E0_PTEAL|nr:uncharacterized protein PEAK3 [Pteropus alecto]ELK19340.1 hypothetical protein PAL_GLEAN10005984 [Pteropus alecto]
MNSPEPPTATPGPSTPTWPTQPTYSNLGKVRAHLLPSKACRPRTSGSSSTDPLVSPPPLPNKTLTRARSLPAHRVPKPSPTPAGQARRPLLGSRSVDESQAGDDKAGSACLHAELLLCSSDTELGLSFHDLLRPEAVHAMLEARQLEGLRSAHALLRARFLGGRPGPCRPGHSFRLLDRSPCVESGEALYYRTARVDKEMWHVLAAKVPKPGAKEPHPWGLELQASLPAHFNVQGLCGLVPKSELPEAPWSGPVALTAEEPECTVAQWLAEAGARRPADFAWALALLLLQLSAALECLEARGAALAELRPENLLLAAPRGCAAWGPPRLLLADFGQTLLWGPGAALRSRGAPLGPWLRVRRALLVLHLAERAAGGEAPGLEDWLCCEYLLEATEASVGCALDLLWG